MRQYQKRPWAHDYKSNKYRTSRLPNYGTVDISTLPSTLGRPLTKPYDQGYTQGCAAYAAAKNGELMHGFPCSPEWQADKITRLQGYPVLTQGSNPNAAMDSQLLVKTGGHLPQVNWDPNQAAALDSTAQDYSSRDYTKPDQGNDIFDSIKIGLYMHYDFNTKLGAGVQAFSGWYTSFNTEHVVTIDDTPNAGTATPKKAWWKRLLISISPSIFGSLLGYHSYLFYDWTTRADGTEVLCFYNSYGTYLSPTGTQTMTREVVNKVLSQWGSSYKQPDELTLEQAQAARQSTVTGNIWRQLLNAWYQIILLFYHA